MSLWFIHAGRHGDQQETALTEGLICHGWNELPDYSEVATRDEFRSFYQRFYPLESGGRLIARFSQVWRFAHEIEIGDRVAMPIKSESAFAFGRVTGGYQYKKIASNVMHTRSVDWEETLIPRSAFPQDILYAMGSALTLFKVTRNDAESRVERILAGFPTAMQASPDGVWVEAGDSAIAGDAELDIERMGRDEILKYIQSNFKSHDLTRLVDAVLRAQGYKTVVSPPGPDGGVDILAGSGSLGFDHPRLCVQVKSGVGAEGQSTFNELLGVMSKFDSRLGLLVSWGGFTQPLHKDARKEFFRIRLWNQGDLVDAILQSYDRLDPEIRAELPLKRLWAIDRAYAD
jgi:restriction system protein